MQQEELLLDPEEETEKKLVNTMAKAIMVLVAGLILLLALRPWIQRYLEEQKAQEGEGALLGNETVAAVEGRPSVE